MNKDIVHSEQSTPSKGQFLFHKAEGGQVKIDVCLEDETVWLTQQLMADLFQTTKQNISLHIQNIFEEGELTPQATVKKFLTVRREGSRDVKRPLDFYNPDAFLSVNERDILTHASWISHEMAKESSEAEYEKFSQKRIRQKDRLESDFDKTVKQLTEGKRGKKNEAIH